VHFDNAINERLPLAVRPRKFLFQQYRNNIDSTSVEDTSLIQKIAPDDSIVARRGR